MFSVASANREKSPLQTPNAVVNVPESAVSSGDDDLALSALQQLRSGDRKTPSIRT
jgi:hypothetical protein